MPALHELHRTAAAAVEQQKNEQLTGILKKVEGEEEFLKKQQATIDEKSNKLRKNYASLKKSQDTTECTESTSGVASAARKM